MAHVHHVAGEALAQWRASIRLAAREAGASLSPLPINLTVVFGMPRPKAHMRWSGGKLIPKMQHYYDLPTVMPDVDKLLRAVMDALTGVCYADDAQVVSVQVAKVYGETTYIEVRDIAASSQQTLPIGVEQEEEAHPDTGPLHLRHLPPAGSG